MVSHFLYQEFPNFSAAWLLDLNTLSKENQFGVREEEGKEKIYERINKGSEVEICPFEMMLRLGIHFLGTFLKVKADLSFTLYTLTLTLA